MKNYLRVVATSTLLIFGLSTAYAQTATSTDTTSTTSKRKSRKKKDTSGTAAPAAASAPAAAPTPATTSTTAPGKATKGKAPTPVANASDSDIAAAKTSGKVWVNSESKVYHKGGQWYGKTKKGQFMTEDDAKKAGYHEAKREIGTKKS